MGIIGMEYLVTKAFARSGSFDSLLKFIEKNVDTDLEALKILAPFIKFNNRTIEVRLLSSYAQ